MEQVDGKLIVSATDLVGHLACPHLTTLNLAAARKAPGHTPRPQREDPSLEIITRRGNEHEEAHLETLKETRTVAEIADPSPDLGRVDGLLGRETETVEAMREGVDVVFQATFLDQTDDVSWRGHADFLHRVESPSNLGSHAYEPEDTKLARSVRASAVLQLSHYAEQVERLQGTAPKEIHVALGSKDRESVRLDDVSAYYRTVRDRFVDELDAEIETYPVPTAHCAVCDWQDHCDQQRRDDDHLTLVAGLGVEQTRKLEAHGITTVAALAEHEPNKTVPGIGATTIARLVRQARLQRQRIEGEAPPFVIAPDVEPGLGLAALPAPDPGDLFYDIEGDPFVGTDGIEYLHGIGWLDGNGNFDFEAHWAHDPVAEKAAFEAVVDRIVAQRQKYPAMHVYHYAPYERTALGRLAAVYATREDEVDQILRDDVLVDLFRITRQGLVVGSPSYSLKKLEPIYMPPRDTAITDGGSSIVEYERWLESKDQKILDDIEEYNRDDVWSTQLLRDWLAGVADGSVAPTGDLGEASVSAPVAAVVAHIDKTPTDLDDDKKKAKRAEEDAAVAALTDSLLDGLEDAFPPEDTDDRARWLLAHLLRWHRREDRPEWWRHFDRLESTAEELLADSEAISGLEQIGDPEPDKQSYCWTYKFEATQEHKLAVGKTVVDPATKAIQLQGGPKATTPGSIVEIDSTAGRLVLKRRQTSTAPHPEALIPGGPIGTDPLRRSLRDLAQTMIDRGIDGDGPGTAALQLLARRPPRIDETTTGEPLRRPSEETVDAAVRLVSGLDRSYLPIQGPPGAGKTYTAARVIVDLVRQGRKVGITANSHAVISNLLAAVFEQAENEGVATRAYQKYKASEEEEQRKPDGLTYTDDNDVVAGAIASGECDIIAGTAWLFAREELVSAVDTLVVDEAGQLSLANVCAVAPAAENLVLVGDPRQLAQPSKGTHPVGAGASALEHVLDGATTVADHLGLFLDRTWRMHPEITEFISEQIYDSRLEAEAHTVNQVVGYGPVVGGSGLRWMPVPHSGNRTSSEEEVAAVDRTYRALLGRPWTDRDGQQRTIGAQDIVVVAPYNAQVRRLGERLPAGAAIGTVDRFQGREAAVVIVSLAASSAEDVPRGMEFLYSRNRLNVAVSRAQALCVLVASPTLLEVRCRTVAQMKLANALCRYTELATEIGP